MQALAGSFFLASTVVFCASCLAIGIHLALLSRRTGERPELYLGLAIALTGCFGYGLLVGATMAGAKLGVDAPVVRFMSLLGLALNHVGSPRMREQPLPEGPGEWASPAPGPLAGLLDAEARRVLDDALGELPPEQRAVFVLRAFEELSYEEIAEGLGLQPGTVMSRLFRARQRLARALGPYLGAATPRKGGAA